MNQKKNRKEPEVSIAAKVIPNANRNEFIGWKDGELRISIKATAERGKANQELIRFLAKALKVNQSQIQICQGLTSRHKRLLISGLSFEQVHALLPP